MGEIKLITNKVAELTSHLVDLRAGRKNKEHRLSKDEKEQIANLVQQDAAFNPAAATDAKLIGPGAKKEIQVDAPEEDDNSSMSSRRSDYSDSSSSRISDVTDIDPDEWNTDQWYEKVKRLFEKLQNKQEWDMMVSLRKQFDSKSAERNAGLEHIQSLDDDRRKESERYRNAQHRFDKDIEDSQVHIFTTLNNFNNTLHGTVESIRNSVKKRAKKRLGPRFSFSNMRKEKRVLWADGEELETMDIVEGSEEKTSAAGELLRIISGQQNQIASLKTTAFLAEKKVTLHRSALTHFERMQTDPDNYPEAPEEVQNILVDMMMKREAASPVGKTDSSRYMTHDDLSRPMTLSEAMETPAPKLPTAGSRARHDDRELITEINSLKRLVKEVQEGMAQLNPKAGRVANNRRGEQRRTMKAQIAAQLAAFDSNASAGSGEASVAASPATGASGRKTRALESKDRSGQPGQLVQPGQPGQENRAGNKRESDMPLSERFTKLQLRINQGQITLQRASDEHNLFLESIRKAEQWRSRSMNRDASKRRERMKAQKESEKAADNTVSSVEQEELANKRFSILANKRASLATASAQREQVELQLQKAHNEWRTVSASYIGTVGRPPPTSLEEGREIIQDLDEQIEKLQQILRAMHNTGNKKLKANNLPTLEMPPLVGGMQAGDEAGRGAPQDEGSSIDERLGSTKTNMGRTQAVPKAKAGRSRAVGAAETPAASPVRGQTSTQSKSTPSAASQGGGTSAAPSASPPGSSAGNNKQKEAATPSGSRGDRGPAQGKDVDRRAAATNADEAERRTPRDRATGGMDTSGAGAVSGAGSSSNSKPPTAGSASNSKPPTSRARAGDLSNDAPSGRPAEKARIPGGAPQGTEALSRQGTVSHSSHEPPPLAGHTSSKSGSSASDDDKAGKVAHAHFDVSDGEELPAGFSLAMDDDEPSSPNTKRSSRVRKVSVRSPGGPLSPLSPLSPSLQAGRHESSVGSQVLDGAGADGMMQGNPELISRLLDIQRENIEITEQIKVYKDMLNNAKKNGTVSQTDMGNLAKMNEQTKGDDADEQMKEISEFKHKVRKLQKTLKAKRQYWNKLEYLKFGTAGGSNMVRRSTFAAQPHGMQPSPTERAGDGRRESLLGAARGEKRASAEVHQTMLELDPSNIGQPAGQPAQAPRASLAVPGRLSELSTHGAPRAVFSAVRHSLNSPPDNDGSRTSTKEPVDNMNVNGRRSSSLLLAGHLYTSTGRRASFSATGGRRADQRLSVGPKPEASVIRDGELRDGRLASVLPSVEAESMQGLMIGGISGRSMAQGNARSQPRRGSVQRNTAFGGMDFVQDSDQQSPGGFMQIQGVRASLNSDENLLGQSLSLQRQNTQEVMRKKRKMTVHMGRPGMLQSSSNKRWGTAQQWINRLQKLRSARTQELLIQPGSAGSVDKGSKTSSNDFFGKTQ